jgi:hypothetical protein
MASRPEYSKGVRARQDAPPRTLPLAFASLNSVAVLRSQLGGA